VIISAIDESSSIDSE